MSSPENVAAVPVLVGIALHPLPDCNLVVFCEREHMPQKYNKNKL